MKNDNLKQFVTLRQSLRAEQVVLEKRLAEIQAALADREVGTPATTAAPHIRNVVSLKAAILRATRDKALTKPEILAAVQKAGYQFTTAKPMNSINVVLYGKQPKFKKANGKFRPMS